jgi:Polysaccharide lyase
VKQRAAVIADLEAALSQLSRVQPKSSSAAWLKGGKDSVRHALTTVKAEPTDVAPPPEPEPEPTPEPEPPAEGPMYVADFEQGLKGWNTAGMGSALPPQIVTDIVKQGTQSARVILTGTQERQELIFGGNGTSDFSGAVILKPGDERWYAFSLYVVSMVYGRPGGHNLIWQLHTSPDEAARMGLMLWDYGGDTPGTGGKGLWTHGPPMAGDRFLGPLEHGRWHDFKIGMRLTKDASGWYEVRLNGNRIDRRENISILGNNTSAYLKSGIYRNPEAVNGTSELRLDNGRFGLSLASVA